MPSGVVSAPSLAVGSRRAITARLPQEDSAAAAADGWSDERDPRRNNFDALRFLLACVVVFSHSYTLVLPHALWSHEPVYYLTRGQTSAGQLAVYGFFAISGFLVAQSWVRSRGAAEFLRRRALRLYPGFAAMTLVCVLVVVPLATGNPQRPHAVLVAKMAYRIILLDAWEEPAAFRGQQYPAINGSVWTIPYELWCYVGLAVLAAAGILRRRSALVALFGVAFVLYQAFRIFNCGPVWTDVLPRAVAYHVGRIIGVPAKWPEFATYFLAGTVFLMLRNTLRHSALIAAGCAVALSLGAASKQSLPLLLPVCGVYLLFWFALHPRIRLTHFAAHGDFSYGIYLYAFPIQQLLIKRIGPSHVTPMNLFALALPMSVIAGVLSWHLVEKPFLRSRHSYFAGISRPRRARLSPARPAPR
jgi:peptidoglycan/LPS O-acetylase OafA/YrhL